MPPGPRNGFPAGTGRLMLGPKWPFWARPITSPVAPVTATALEASADDDVGAVTDQADRDLQGFARDTADSVAVGDAATATTSHPRTASDSVTVSDSAARTAAHPRTASDSVTVGDAPTRVVSNARTASDSVSVSDATASRVGKVQNARSLATGSDVITMARGGIPTSGDGPFSLAFIVKPSGTAYNSFFETLMTGGSIWDALIMNTHRLQLFADGQAPNSISPSPITNGAWHLLVYRKPGNGYAQTPRYTFQNLENNSAVVHGDGNSTLGTGSVTATHTGVKFVGNRAVVIIAGAYWNSYLSDADAASLGAGTLQTWVDLSPAALWKLDQASTATPVPDFMRGGADQSAISGTSVVSLAVPFDMTATPPSVSLPRTATEPATTVSDAATRIVTMARTGSDSVTVSDAATRIAAHPRTATDSTSVSDAATRTAQA